MLTLLLWLRYLKQRKIVFLSIAAVTVSVALLIVVASLFNGFIQAYEQNAEDLMGEILLSPLMGVTNYEALIDQLEAAPEIAAASPVILADGLLHVGSHVQAVQVWGIEPNSLFRVMKLKESLLRQKESSEAPSFSVPGLSDSKTGGYIGIGIIGAPNDVSDAYDYAAARSLFGERAILSCGATIEEKTGGGASNMRRRTLRFYVADAIKTGNHLFDAESVYVPLKALHDRLFPAREEVKIDRFQIKLAPDVGLSKGKDVILGIWESFARSQHWSDYLIKQTDIATTRELQKRYMQVIAQQMSMLMAIFGAIDVGVVALVFCIFYLIVKIKQKDVAIIKSCGGSFWLITKLFLGFGACVGVVGVILGIGLGWLFVHNINAIEAFIFRISGLKMWDSSVYLFEKIPNRMDWSSVWRIGLVAIAATVVGALLPACIAALTRPVRVLRYE